MAETIKVTLASTTVDARPAAPAEIVVGVHNTGPTVEQYDIEVDGLPAAWYILPESRIALFPNDRDEARITILPAQEAGMDAGSHPFTITVVARAEPGERSSVEGTLRVAAAAALDAQLRPSRATGRKARYRVLLRNRGNADLDVDADAFDSEEGCDFVFKPPIVHLKPGQRATMSMRVRPLHKSLVGPEHPFDFQVAVQPSIGEARPLQGIFTYRPRFRSSRPFVRLVALAVVAAALIIAAPFIIPRLRHAEQVAEAISLRDASIGAVKLGDTNPRMVAANLGAGATMTKQDTVITKPQGARGVVQARLRQGQVVALTTTSPAVKLADGIHVGSTVADVKKTLGASLTVVGGSLAGARAGAGAAGAAGANPSPTANNGAAGGGAAGPGSPTAGSGAIGGSPTIGASPAISGSVMTASANALAGGTLVLTNRNTVNGQHPIAYFDLNKAGTRVTSIRMGVFPWITPDHGGPTRVGAITSTTTWTLAGAPYLISAPLRIPRGVTLTINPGVFVYFTTKSASLYVDGGALQAVGTPQAPVVFTAIDDQQHGAFDTLNRPAPQKSDWGGLGVTAAGGTLNLDNTEVYYGSSPADVGNAEIYVDGDGSPTVSIRYSTIEAAAGYGLNAGNAPANTVIQSNVFNADNYPLLINGGISLDDSNLYAPKGEVHNTHDAVYVRRGATVAANGATVAWTQQGVPFVLQGDETVGPGGTLEIGPDVILKGYDAGSSLTVDSGTLIVAGQKDHSVLMTSYRDDAQGGDSNGDGKASSPAQGDWHGLVIKGTGRASIHRLKIWWAGSNGRPAIRIADQASVEIGRTEVAESGADGISDSSDHPVAIDTSFIHDNAGFGLNFSGSPDARGVTTLAGDNVTHNAKGDIGVDDAPPPAPVANASPTPPPPTPDMAMVTPPAGATPTTSSASATPTVGGAPTSNPADTATPTPSGVALPGPAVTATPAPSNTALAAPYPPASPSPGGTAATGVGEAGSPTPAATTSAQ